MLSAQERAAIDAMSLEDLRALAYINEELLANRERILDALPCPVHGPCVPYVLEWIAAQCAAHPAPSFMRVRVSPVTPADFLAPLGGPG